MKAESILAGIQNFSSAGAIMKTDDLLDRQTLQELNDFDQELNLWKLQQITKAEPLPSVLTTRKIEVDII